MKNLLNKTFPLFQLEESRLEDKFRTDKDCTYMVVNGYEVRWPRFENFISACRAGHVEYFTPGGPEENWNLIPAEDAKF